MQKKNPIKDKLFGFKMRRYRWLTWQVRNEIGEYLEFFSIH